MDDDVDVPHRRDQGVGLGDVAGGELHPRQPARPAVGLIAHTVETAENAHGRSRGQQRSDRRWTDRAGSAGHQGSHGGR